MKAIKRRQKRFTVLVPSHQVQGWSVMENISTGMQWFDEFLDDAIAQRQESVREHMEGSEDTYESWADDIPCPACGGCVFCMDY